MNESLSAGWPEPQPAAVKSSVHGAIGKSRPRKVRERPLLELNALRHREHEARLASFAWRFHDDLAQITGAPFCSRPEAGSRNASGR